MRIVIFGITGQDGFYLTNFYLKKGFKVYGIYRSESSQGFKRLKSFYASYIDKQLFLSKCAYLSQDYLDSYFKLNKPDYIYYMSGQSNIELSFSERVVTEQSIFDNFKLIIQSLLKLDQQPIIFNPMSSDCFEDIGKSMISLDTTELYDNSPYAMSKNRVYEYSKIININYGFKIKHGFLFNHESPIRPNNYVLKKICNYLKSKKFLHSEPLFLGNIEIIRNWGLAEEFVIGFDIFMNSDHDEVIFCSSNSYSIKYLLEYSFGKFNLDYSNYISINGSFLRKKDVLYKIADTTDIKNKLNWHPRHDALSIMDLMINSDKIFYF